MKKANNRSNPQKINSKQKTKRKSKNTKANSPENKAALHPNVSGLDDAVKQLRSSLKNIRVIIYKIYKLKLWSGRYESFEEFIKEELSDQCSRTNAYRHVQAAEIDDALQLPIGTVPITATELFSTKKLSKKSIKKIWTRAQKLSNKEVPTIPSLKRCLEDREKAKAAYNWITKPVRWNYLLEEISDIQRKEIKAGLSKLKAALNE